VSGKDKRVKGTARKTDYAKFLDQMVKRVIYAESAPRFRATDRPVRCSSPPVCEIATAFNIVRGGSSYKQTFMSEFYTSLGTEAHRIFQKWAGRLGYLYGDWRCACGQRKTGRGPMICPKCKREMAYQEVGVTVSKDLTGRTDGLVPVKPNEFIVMDLKFVGPSTLARVKQSPSPIHYHQINLYAYGLQKQGKKIVGVAIIYISRATPSQYHVHYFPGVDTKVVKKALKTIKKIKTFIERQPERIAELRPLCSPDDEPLCPFHRICFESTEGPHAYLRTLLKTNKKTRKE